MTLEELHEKTPPGQKRYCFNEITGQLVLLDTFGYNTSIPGSAGSPAELLTLLFDRASINESWNAIGTEEALQRILRYEAENSAHKPSVGIRFAS